MTFILAIRLNTKRALHKSFSTHNLGSVVQAARRIENQKKAAQLISERSNQPYIAQSVKPMLPCARFDVNIKNQLIELKNQSNKDFDKFMENESPENANESLKSYRRMHLEMLKVASIIDNEAGNKSNGQPGFRDVSS